MGIATKKIYHLTGLSTDTKEIPADISTGSTFLETDTGITYVYNKTMNSWQISKNTEIPHIDAPCRGILSIELTSSAGLVDTYTIKYTNGSETTYEVVNGAYVDVNPSIKEPMVAGKIYTLDINTEKFNTYKATILADGETYYDSETRTVYLVSGIIANKTFWPRIDEGKFILQLKKTDTQYLFTYTGTVDGQDIWQALVVDENEQFIRYVGHFEYEDEKNIKTSNYYFKAKPQKLSFVELNKAIIAETTRAKASERDLQDILVALDKKLDAEIDRAIATDAAETARAQAAEADITSAVETFQAGLDELHERAVEGEANLFLTTQELITEVENLSHDSANKLAAKADRNNPDQRIIANKVEAVTTEFYAEDTKTLRDADQYIAGKVYTTIADATNKIVALNVDVNHKVNIDVKEINITGAEDGPVINGDVSLVGAINHIGGIATDIIEVREGLYSPIAELDKAVVEQAKIETLTATVETADLAIINTELKVDGVTNTKNVKPQTDASFNLGVTDKRYNNLYLAGKIVIDANNEVYLPRVKDTLAYETEITILTNNLNTEIEDRTAAVDATNANLTAEITRATAAEAILTADVANINSKIPGAANEDNKLADKEFVNSSIASATATFRGNYDVTTLKHNGVALTVDASHLDIEEALFDNEGNESRLNNPRNNDYVIISFPDPFDVPNYSKFERYKFTVVYDPQTGEPTSDGAWEFEYELNHSSFTAEQWAAINSTMTKDLSDWIRAKFNNSEAITSDTSLTPDDIHYTSTNFVETRLDEYNTYVIIPEVANTVNNARTLSVSDWTDIAAALEEI